MPHTEQRSAHKYEVGEEVVVRLKAGGVFDVAAGDLVAGALPDWTIAEILSRESAFGEARYRVAFNWAGSTYSCVVLESAIEGTA